MKRFWDKVEKTEGCWLWTGKKTKQGYGQFRIGSRTDGSRRMVLAHRFVMDEPDCLVLHHCDNPSCVNPDHLYHGNHFDNMEDRQVRNRAGRKLDPEKVREIRELWRTRSESQANIGKMYGVSRGVVNKVITRKIWRHIA